MSHPRPGTSSVKRIQQTLLTRAERRLLDWLCRRMPLSMFDQRVGAFIAREAA